MNTSSGTNTLAELLALWGLLLFANVRNIGLKLILGDSRTIIDWAMHRQKLQSLVLQPWMVRVWSLLDLLSPLPCQHIYREFNSQADSLSKRGIDMPPGVIGWQELISGVIIADGSLSCTWDYWSLFWVLLIDVMFVGRGWIIFWPELPLSELSMMVFMTPWLFFGLLNTCFGWDV